MKILRKFQLYLSRDYDTRDLLVQHFQATSHLRSVIVLVGHFAPDDTNNERERNGVEVGDRSGGPKRR